MFNHKKKKSTQSNQPSPAILIKQLTINVQVPSSSRKTFLLLTSLLIGIYPNLLTANNVTIANKFRVSYPQNMAVSSQIESSFFSCLDLNKPSNEALKTSSDEKK